MNPFTTEGFVPRAECGDWPPWLLWTHVLSETVIGVALLVLGLVILAVSSRRKATRYLYVLFSMICFGCAATHTLGAAIFWWPAYYLDGLFRAAGALMVTASAVCFVRALPWIMSFRSVETTLALQADVQAAAAELSKTAEEQKPRLVEETARLLDGARVKAARVQAIGEELSGERSSGA